MVDQILPRQDRLSFGLVPKLKKLEVYRNKKELRGQNIYITENLTNLRLSRYKKAMEKFGYKNVWSSEGRIFTRINNSVTEIDHKYKLD